MGNCLFSQSIEHNSASFGFQARTALSKVLLCDAQDLLALLRSTKRHRESKDVGCKCLRLYANRCLQLSAKSVHDFNVFKDTTCAWTWITWACTTGGPGWKVKFCPGPTPGGMVAVWMPWGVCTCNCCPGPAPGGTVTMMLWPGMLTAPAGTKAKTRAVRACFGLQKPVQAVRYSTRTEPAVEESWAPHADLGGQCWWISWDLKSQARIRIQ